MFFFPPTIRPKCSVSSVLVAPGPCGKTKPDTSEIIKEEQHQTVDGESYLGQTLKTRSFSGSNPLSHTERVRRNCYTYSDRSKHKSHSGKLLSRQSSLTKKTEQAEVPQLKTDTAPSEGECCVSFPLGATQVNSLNQTSHEDTNNSTSFSQHINAQNDSSKCFHIATNRQEESMTGNHLAENKEEGTPPETQSTVRKLERKVRPYKKKRRKLDTHVELVNPGDVPDNSMLSLWELFQSSDDMDVEFHGFED